MLIFCFFFGDYGDIKSMTLYNVLSLKMVTNLVSSTPKCIEMTSRESLPFKIKV